MLKIEEYNNTTMRKPELQPDGREEWGDLVAEIIDEDRELLDALAE